MDKKQQLIELWRQCFGDPEAFIELFFDRVYKEENALTIERDGQIVSALHILPYTMTYYGTEISVSYIYGACTAPAWQGQGLMRQLLQESFEVMKSREVALAVLIPSDKWLFDYYREQGFTEAFDYTAATYIHTDVPVQAPMLTVVAPEVPSIQQLYAYFDRKLRERPCCLLHTYDDFVTILREFQLSGGQMLTALDITQKPVGMVFLYPTEDRVHIKELLYDTDQVKSLLLQEATVQNHVTKASYLIPPVQPSTRPLGMARVLDTARLITHWRSRHPHSPLTESDLEQMDIPTLTRHLLDYTNRQAYMSLMMD